MEGCNILSLENSVKDAKSSLEPLEERIIIKNHKSCQISIVNVSSSGLKFIYVFKLVPDGKRDILYRSVQNKFRSVFIEGCYDVDFVIGAKLNKILFLECTQSQISVRKGIISTLELVRCENLIVDIRDYPIPIFQIDLSKFITVYQRLRECTYVLHFSFDIKTAFAPVPYGKSPKFRIIPCSILGEQTFCTITKSERDPKGFEDFEDGHGDVFQTFALNNISHHFLFLGEM